MQKQRLDNFAYALLRLIGSEEAYQEALTFAVHLARAEDPATGPEERRYYENKARAMEEAIAALNTAKDRIIADYNKRTRGRDGSDLFPWHGMKEIGKLD